MGSSHLPKVTGPTPAGTDHLYVSVSASGLLRGGIAGTFERVLSSGDKRSGTVAGAVNQGKAAVENPLLTAQRMIEQNETDIGELWLGYFATGGNASEFEAEAFLHGIQEPSDLDVELLDLALEDIKEQANALRRPHDQGRIRSETGPSSFSFRREFGKPGKERHRIFGC
jgi:hypothetical protein